MTSLKFAAIQALMGEGEVSDGQKKLVCRCFSSVCPVGGRRAAHSQAKEGGQLP